MHGWPGAPALGEGTAAGITSDTRRGSGGASVIRAERSELAAQVRAAVDDLPERQRLALLLNKFHGLSYEDLAATMKMTVPGVKSLLVRARENVRQRIEPYLRAGVDRWSEKRGTA